MSKLQRYCPLCEKPLKKKQPTRRIKGCLPMDKDLPEDMKPNFYLVHKTCAQEETHQKTPFDILLPKGLAKKFRDRRLGRD